MTERSRYRPVEGKRYCHTFSVLGCDEINSGILVLPG